MLSAFPLWLSMRRFPDIIMLRGPAHRHIAASGSTEVTTNATDVISIRESSVDFKLSDVHALTIGRLLFIESRPAQACHWART